MLIKEANTQKSYCFSLYVHDMDILKTCMYINVFSGWLWVCVLQETRGHDDWNYTIGTAYFLPLGQRQSLLQTNIVVQAYRGAFSLPRTTSPSQIFQKPLHVQPLVCRNRHVHVSSLLLGDWLLHTSGSQQQRGCAGHLSIYGTKDSCDSW